MFPIAFAAGSVAARTLKADASPASPTSIRGRLYPDGGQHLGRASRRTVSRCSARTWSRSMSTPGGWSAVSRSARKASSRRQPSRRCLCVLRVSPLRCGDRQLLRFVAHNRLLFRVTFADRASVRRRQHPNRVTLARKWRRRGSALASCARAARRGATRGRPDASRRRISAPCGWGIRRSDQRTRTTTPTGGTRRPLQDRRVSDDGHTGSTAASFSPVAVARGGGAGIVRCARSRGRDQRRHRGRGRCLRGRSCSSSRSAAASWVLPPSGRGSCRSSPAGLGN